MLKRLGRLIAAFFNRLLGNAEAANAGDLRKEAVRKKGETVRDAKQSLGSLGGQMRVVSREIEKLETEVKALTARKKHFMGSVTAAEPGTLAAEDAGKKARAVHHELNEVTNGLNRWRTELQEINTQYQRAKAQIHDAQDAVKDARKQGKRQDRRLESATRRGQLTKVTSSLRSLDGFDELAELDEAIAAQIDAVEGDTFVAEDFAADASAEANLDLQIARSQEDDEFDRELLAAAAIVAIVTDSDDAEPTDTSRAATPASTGYAESASASAGDSYDSGSSDSGGSSDSSD